MVERLNNMLLKKAMDQWRKTKDKIRKYLKRNENGNTTLQNLWDAAKAVLRGKFIAIQVYLKKHEKSEINNLIYHLKDLEKEQTKLKVSRRKERIKIREEINRDQTMGKINEIKSWFFWNVKKFFDKSLASLIKKRERTQINKIRSEREKLQLISQRYKKMLREYLE